MAPAYGTYELPSGERRLLCKVHGMRAKAVMVAGPGGVPMEEMRRRILKAAEVRSAVRKRNKNPYWEG